MTERDGFRVEVDSLGEIDVPADRYWGAQTERARRNFPIGDQGMPARVLRALFLVKKAAALTNLELRLRKAEVLKAIVQAADEALRGELDEEFPLRVWQSGSGTQTNMNVNEVLANRASQILGGRLGKGRLVHPNDDVNKCQSSNDVFPTAMHIAAVQALTEDLIPAAEGLRASLERKAKEFAGVVKTGRTHLMDAVPIGLGQEFASYAAMLDEALAACRASLDGLSELPLGGTAVGTGLNAHPRFAKRAIERLAEMTGHPFRSARDRLSVTSGHQALVRAHAALSQLACVLSKVANDIRWMASGPRAGLCEICLPANEPGSSIMPGKVNPTQAEAVLMVAARVLGNNTTIAFSASFGNFELNVMKPVIIYAFLESADLLAGACRSFAERCVAGIRANEERLRQYVENSLMLVTALVPHIGYDSAAKVAKYALDNGISLRESAKQLGLVDPQEFDRIVDPERMARPHR